MHLVKVFITLALATVVGALVVCPCEQEFVEWVKKFDVTVRDFNRECHTVCAAADRVRAHNHGLGSTYYVRTERGEHTRAIDGMFTRGLNRFSAQPPADFRRQRNGFRAHSKADPYPPPPPNHTAVCPTWETVAGLDLPPTFSWVAKGAVSPVKDQGACGSCWAFSTTGAVEAAWRIHRNTSVLLSEQQLVDCARADCQGCEGGMFDCAYDYVEGGGLETEAAYPYVGVDENCNASAAAAHYKVVNWTQIPFHDEECIKYHVFTRGPVSVAMDASQWQDYSSGIFPASECETDFLDHAILVVGWGSAVVHGRTVPYWLVKNSWGTDWGEDGYIRVERGVGACGLDVIATVPIL